MIYRTSPRLNQAPSNVTNEANIAIAIPMISPFDRPLPGEVATSVAVLEGTVVDLEPLPLVEICVVYVVPPEVIVVNYICVRRRPSPDSLSIGRAIARKYIRRLVCLSITATSLTTFEYTFLQ
jgi:hypothetical protein